MRLMDLSLAFEIGVGLIYILLLFTFFWVIGIRLGPRDRIHGALRILCRPCSAPPSVDGGGIIETEG